MDEMVKQAMARWHGTPPQRIAVEQPNNANATVSLTRAESRDIGTTLPVMVFSGTTGAVQSALGESVAAASATRSTMVGLHVAHFAPPLLRALFFVSGLAGALMVATGALLWAVKTRQSHAKHIAATGRVPFGLRLVEALNLGVIAGLPIAFAAYFWANRLLPADMSQRSSMEIQAFFGAWAVAALLAQWKPTREMWRVLLWTGAGLFAGLPVLNAITTTSHLWVTLRHGPLAVAGFDLTVLAIGIGIGAAAWMLGKRRPEKRAAPAVRHGAAEVSP